MVRITIYVSINVSMYQLQRKNIVVEALQVCRSLWKNSVKGLKKKIKFEETIGLHEVFLEAVPSTIIMTFLLVKASPELGKVSDSIVFSHHYLFPDKNVSLRTVIVDYSSSQSKLFFFLTFFSSVFSASLGLAKCLKNGVARIIGPGGPMDGLLSARFILAFFGINILSSTRQKVLKVAKIKDANYGCKDKGNDDGVSQ